MGKTISFTIYPSALGAEFLSVSDAMRQILDLVEALEKTEAPSAESRQIVWRLTDAHTNSPPFSVTAEAFSLNPAVYVDMEAQRVAERFSSGVQDLLAGRTTDWIDKDTAAPVKRVLQRNLNGVGRTEIAVNDDEPLNVVPTNARAAVVALERRELDWKDEGADYRRTEFGSVEVEVCGITRWYEKPALIVIERLSRDRVTCVLSPDLAEHLGPSHNWQEAWQGERLLVTGALHYGTDGEIARIDAEDAEQVHWTEINLADLQGIDLLQGKSVKEHLNLIRGEDLG